MSSHEASQIKISELQDQIQVELTHKTDELERQAEIIKKFETAYNESLALSVEKDE